MPQRRTLSGPGVPGRLALIVRTLKIRILLHKNEAVRLSFAGNDFPHGKVLISFRAPKTDAQEAI